MSKLIISLHKTKESDLPQVGCKAFSLARMKQIGFMVPTGFCITAAAFQEHLEANNLFGCIKSAVGELNSASLEKRKSLLLEIRQAIINAPLAVDLRSEIENHYQTLAANRLAVRSSATAEDLPGHSFAGQYETYLGIADLAGCIDSVKKCWASLWTQRAYEYRQKNGFNHLAVNMAVIVQALVEADASGVIFTTDPVSGSSSRIIVEACFGLGEALVSGKVTPDRYIVRKRNLKIISHRVSEKTQENEQACPPCISKRIARKLAKSARKVEARFGGPQDIEWAVYKNKIYFLQARPITTIPPKKSWEDSQIWCSFPVEEVLPDVVTPITLSVIETAGNNLESVFRMLCMDHGGHPVAGLVAGRLYFNLNIWAAVIRCLPGLKNYNFRKLAGSHKGLVEICERLEDPDNEGLPNMKFKRVRFFLKVPLLIIFTLTNTPEKGQAIVAKIGAKSKEWDGIDVPGLSSGEIAQYCRDITIYLCEVMDRLLYLFSVMMAFPLLHTICTKWLSDDGSCAKKLLAGLGKMDDAIAGLDLWRLAVAADATPQVRDFILSDDNWRTIEGKLSQTNSGEEFLKSWDGFMARHGHHCQGELELYNRQWFETPDYILGLVRSYTNCINKTDPIENHSKLTQQRQQLEQECRQKLRNPIKRMIFNHLLLRSQQGSIFRENVKSEVIKLLTVMRKMLLDLGNTLYSKGIFESPDDIFFLKLEEIEPVIQNKADFNVKEIIASRRDEYEKHKSVTPPKVVIGKFDPDNFVPDVVDADIDILNGLAVSPGMVTGKARVILRADTDEHVLPGEILVAPFTDPGWTPYFIPAAAIVMDQGGLLSHGSIIAREYGIPAVVNVGPATKIIKTGQTIQVDANKGVVKIC